jgi:hypothetical protein
VLTRRTWGGGRTARVENRRGAITRFATRDGAGLGGSRPFFGLHLHGAGTRGMQGRRYGRCAEHDDYIAVGGARRTGFAPHPPGGGQVKFLDDQVSSVQE